MTVPSLLLRLMPLPQPGRLLAEGEWRTLARIAEALLPGDPDAVNLPPEDVADNIENFLIRGRSKRAWRVRALLYLVEWSPVLCAQKPLSRMSLAQRRRLIQERYIDGRGLWGICSKVRYLVLMGTYGDARMHVPTGYVPVSKRRRFTQSEHNGRAVTQ